MFVLPPPPSAPSSVLPDAAAPLPQPSPVSSTTADLVSRAVASARQAVAAELGANWDDGDGGGGYGGGDASGPGGFLVTGAGSEDVNGFYRREGEYGGAPLFTNGDWWLLRYTMKSGNSWWYIADKNNLDSDDGDMYRVQYNGTLPPTDVEWRKAKDGVLPTPKLRAETSERRSSQMQVGAALNNQL